MKEVVRKEILNLLEAGIIYPVADSEWVSVGVKTGGSRVGGPPPPNGHPVFELKPLPDNLKYAYLDEKKIYMMLLLVLTFQSKKKKDY